jgi:hypothetical protein
MMLADAIDSAVSEHAVYFLVTAYLESLHHFHTSLRIPECVVALPLGGMDDLMDRVRALHAISTASDEGPAAAVEAIAVLECALARLRRLAATPPATPDTLSSARKAA